MMVKSMKNKLFNRILYENNQKLVYVDSDSGKTIRNLPLFTKFIGLLDLNKTKYFI